MTIRYLSDKPTETGLYLVLVDGERCIASAHVSTYDGDVTWEQFGVEYDYWTHCPTALKIEIVRRIDLDVIFGDKKTAPIENLMGRRMGEKKELERRVKQAMRGAAVSNRMLDAANKKLIERMGEVGFIINGPAAEDLKAAIKAALMEYGK
jgi:hypothetical protein